MGLFKKGSFHYSISSINAGEAVVLKLKTSKLGVTTVEDVRIIEAQTKQQVKHIIKMGQYKKYRKLDKSIINAHNNVYKH